MTGPWNLQQRELSNGNLLDEMLAWRKYSFQSPQTSSQYEASPQLPLLLLHGYPHWLDPLSCFSLSLSKFFLYYWIILLFCFALLFWLKNCSFTNWIMLRYGFVGEFVKLVLMWLSFRHIYNMGLCILTLLFLFLHFSG